MIPPPSFPALRMRRLRRHDWSRRLVAENVLASADFIWPIFLIEGKNKRQPVPSMPGVERFSVDLAVEAAEEAAGLGIPPPALFPHTEDRLKKTDGREALNPKKMGCQAGRAIKKKESNLRGICGGAL